MNFTSARAKRLYVSLTTMAVTVLVWVVAVKLLPAEYVGAALFFLAGNRTAIALRPLVEKFVSKTKVFIEDRVR